jgi:hypothetical protein
VETDVKQNPESAKRTSISVAHSASCGVEHPNGISP